MRWGQSTKTPCSSGTQSDGSPLSCLLRANGETKGSPPEGLARVRCSCFCLALSVYSKHIRALWERGQLTPLISSAGRDRVSPPLQNNTSPKVTLRPHTGSRCQPCLTEPVSCQRGDPEQNGAVCPDCHTAGPSVSHPPLSAGFREASTWHNNHSISTRRWTTGATICSTLSTSRLLA